MEEIDYSQNLGVFFENIDKHTREPLFVWQTVRKSKSVKLKTRIQTLLNERGISEVQFYKDLGLSKQAWYDLSWGRFEPAIWLRVKISKKLKVDSAVIWG